MNPIPGVQPMQGVLVHVQAVPVPHMQAGVEGRGKPVVPHANSAKRMKTGDTGWKEITVAKTMSDLE